MATALRATRPAACGVDAPKLVDAVRVSSWSSVSRQIVVVESARMTTTKLGLVLLHLTGPGDLQQVRRQRATQTTTATYAVCTRGGCHDRRHHRPTPVPRGSLQVSRQYDRLMAEAQLDARPEGPP